MRTKPKIYKFRTLDDLLDALANEQHPKSFDDIAATPEKKSLFGFVFAMIAMVTRGLASIDFYGSRNRQRATRISGKGEGFALMRRG